MVRFINKIIDAVLSFLHLSKFKEQILYLAVGVMTTLVDWIVFALFEIFVPPVGGDLIKAISPNILAYFMSWFVAVVFAYFASRIFVFEPTHERIFTQILKFFGARAITLAISIAGDIFFSGEYAVIKIENAYIVKAIIAVIVIILNYITSKLLVFRAKAKDKDERGEES